MCGSSPEVDTSYQDQMLEDARIARKEEEARQARIGEGNTAIGENFSQFDQGFYDAFRGNFMDYYQPQLDDQFGDANNALTFDLARRGKVNSTAAAASRADLSSAYDDALAGVASQATGQTDRLRSQINNEKASLVSMLNATGDSERAANDATSRSQNLFASQPEYNPLGDIFAGLTSGWAAGNYGRKQQQAWDRYNGGTGGNNGNNGSFRIVGA